MPSAPRRPGPGPRLAGKTTPEASPPGGAGRHPLAAQLLRHSPHPRRPVCPHAPRHEQAAPGPWLGGHFSPGCPSWMEPGWNALSPQESPVPTEHSLCLQGHCALWLAPSRWQRWPYVAGPNQVGWGSSSADLSPGPPALTRLSADVGQPHGLLPRAQSPCAVRVLPVPGPLRPPTGPTGGKAPRAGGAATPGATPQLMARGPLCPSPPLPPAPASCPAVLATAATPAQGRGSRSRGGAQGGGGAGDLARSGGAASVPCDLSEPPARTLLFWKL